MKTYKVIWTRETKTRSVKESAHFKDMKSAKNFADDLVRTNQTTEQPDIIVDKI